VWCTRVCIFFFFVCFRENDKEKQKMNKAEKAKSKLSRAVKEAARSKCRRQDREIKQNQNPLVVEDVIVGYATTLDMKMISLSNTNKQLVRKHVADRLAQLPTWQSVSIYFLMVKSVCFIRSK
jgi:hypothetical protein